MQRQPKRGLRKKSRGLRKRKGGERKKKKSKRNWTRREELQKKSKSSKSLISNENKRPCTEQS